MLNVSRRSENRLGAFLFLALLATSCVLMLTTQQLSIQAPQVSSVFLATKRSAECSLQLSEAHTLEEVVCRHITGAAVG